MNRPAQTNPDIRASLEAQLNSERERIYAEIHAYPPPIPACDAQFNYLIEKRAFVTQELNRVRALAGNRPSADENTRLLHEYITTSQILSQFAKAEILTALDRTTQSRRMPNE